MYVSARYIRKAPESLIFRGFFTFVQYDENMLKNSLTSPDLATTGGDAVTATAAYGISASCNEVTIYVDGAQIAFPFQVSASVS